MAGHSHASNVKYRKERQGQLKNKIFLSLRKRLTNLIREQGFISDKIFSIAREHSFPKEKLQQILERIKEEKNINVNNSLYLTHFGILIFVINHTLELEVIASEENWTAIKEESVNNYFQIKHFIELEILSSENSEDFMIKTFPYELLDKFENLTFYQKRVNFLFNNNNIRELKETIKLIKEINLLEVEKRMFPLEPMNIDKVSEAGIYFNQLKKKLAHLNYFTNVAT